MTDDMFTDETLAQQEASDPNIIDVEAPCLPAKPQPALPPAEKARAQIQMVQDLRTVIVAHTRKNHWLRFSDKRVVPDGSECRRLLMLLGIRFHAVEPRREDHKDADGEYYTYACIGTAAFLRTDGNAVFEVPAYGIATSRHPFFAKAHGSYRALKDINPANVARMAWTECMKDGVRTLLGLVLDSGELEGIVGEMPGGTDVSGAVSGEGRAKPKDHTAADTPELRNKRDYIFNTVKQLAGSPELARAFLADLTTFTSAKGERVRGKENVGQLTAKQVERLYDRRDTDLSPARYADFLDRWNAAQEGKG